MVAARAATPALAAPTRRGLRRDEYERMVDLGFFHDEPLELVRGSLVRMSPIGTLHAEAVTVLTHLLVTRLGDRALVRVQCPLRAADDSEPQPDLAVVPSGRYLEHHPEGAWLVIEVAESSLAYDRDVKAPLYAESKVDELWIVDVAGRAIEVLRAPRDGQYTSRARVEAGGSVSPERFPDVVVAVDDVVP